MQIEIQVEQREPPTGWVALAHREPVAFVGWLGLIRALSEILSSGGGRDGDSA